MRSKGTVATACSTGQSLQTTASPGKSNSANMAKKPLTMDTMRRWGGSHTSRPITPNNTGVDMDTGLWQDKMGMRRLNVYVSSPFMEEGQPLPHFQFCSLQSPYTCVHKHTHTQWWKGKHAMFPSSALQHPSIVFWKIRKSGSKHITAGLSPALPTTTSLFTPWKLACYQFTTGLSRIQGYMRACVGYLCVCVCVFVVLHLTLFLWPSLYYAEQNSHRCGKNVRNPSCNPDAVSSQACTCVYVCIFVCLWRCVTESDKGSQTERERKREREIERENKQVLQPYKCTWQLQGGYRRKTAG